MRRDVDEQQLYMQNNRGNSVLNFREVGTGIAVKKVNSGNGKIIIPLLP